MITYMYTQDGVPMCLDVPAAHRIHAGWSQPQLKWSEVWIGRCGIVAEALAVAHSLVQIPAGRLLALAASL